ncbi:MAG: hypothetical protein GC145_14920 [Caulobacter sp.]|nr:hypothetical protein [Caulobacter sp.]
MKTLTVCKAKAPLFLRPAPTALARRLGHGPGSLVQRLMRRYLGRAYWPADADIQLLAPPAWPPAATPRLERLRLDIRLSRSWSAAPARTGVRLVTLRGSETPGSRRPAEVDRRPPEAVGRGGAARGRDSGAGASSAFPGLTSAADIRILRQTLVLGAAVQRPPGRAGPAAGSNPPSPAAAAMTVIRTPAQAPSSTLPDDQRPRPGAAPALAVRPEAVLDHPEVADRATPARSAAEAPRPAAWRAPETRPTVLTVRRRSTTARASDRRVLARRGPPPRFDFSPIIPRVARTPDTAAARLGSAAADLAPARPAPADSRTTARSPAGRAAPLEVRRNPLPAPAPSVGQTPGRPEVAASAPAARPNAARQASSRSAPAATPAPPRPELDVPALRRALNHLPVQDIAPLADRLFEHFERHVRRGLERRGRL